MSEPRLGTAERAEYLQRRAYAEAHGLLVRRNQDVADLASAILIALLERDRREAEKGLTTPPRYTTEYVRWVGMTALRTWRRQMIHLDPASFRKKVAAAQKRGLLVDYDTPEALLIARETASAALRKKKRERRSKRAVKSTARRASKRGKKQ